MAPHLLPFDGYSFNVEPTQYNLSKLNFGSQIILALFSESIGVFFSLAFVVFCYPQFCSILPFGVALLLNSEQNGTRQQLSGFSTSNFDSPKVINKFVPRSWVSRYYHTTTAVTIGSNSSTYYYTNKHCKWSIDTSHSTLCLFHFAKCFVVYLRVYLFNFSRQKL